MLTGSVPDHDYAPVHQFNEQLDKSWDRFIRRAIAPRSRDRFSTAADMLEGLQALETLWEERKDKICDLPRPTADPSPRPALRARNPRTRAARIDPRRARQVFPVDSLWRPLYPASHTFSDYRKGVVADSRTGRLWQQAGTAFPVTWQQAHGYVESLNRCRFAGIDQWRLPTIEELLTLLTDDPQQEDFCIEPVFDRTQKWLWSCDRRSFTAAWYVSVEHGFAGWQDFTACYSVRAVHTA
jgi:serine/threonine-protein kinase